MIWLYIFSTVRKSHFLFSGEKVWLITTLTALQAEAKLCREETLFLLLFPFLVLPEELFLDPTWLV